MPGFWRSTAWTSPDGVSRMRGWRPPGRDAIVSERVTKPPSEARSVKAASSRPVPPQPDATITGEVSSRVMAGPPPGVQLVPDDPVAAEHRTVEAGADQPGVTALAGHGYGAALAQAGGAGDRPLERDLAPGAGALGCRGDRVEGGCGAGGVDDRGPGARQHVADDVGHGPLLTDGSVAGDDGDRAGRAAGLQRGEQVGLVRAGDDQGDRAVALTEPLGEREHRRGGVPLADQDAADRLLRQGERPAERPGHLDPRARRLPDQPGRAGTPVLDDQLEGRAVAAGGLDPVDPEGPAGQPFRTGRDGEEGAGAEALGDARRDHGEVVVRTDPAAGQQLAGDVQRSPVGPVGGSHGSPRTIRRGQSGPS